MLRNLLYLLATTPTIMMDVTMPLRELSGEEEIIQLLQKAVREYEEFITLANLSDYPEVAEVSHNRYTWDTPVGLVVTGQSNVKLV